MTVNRPLLVCTCFPGEGHFYPVLALAVHLMKHGYSAVFVADATLKDKIEAFGIEYFPTDNIFTEERMGRLSEISQTTTGLESFSMQFGTLFFGTLSMRTARFHEVLQQLKAEDPLREIVILEDIFNSVSCTYKMGKTLPVGFDRPPKNIGLGCGPLLLESEDLGPLLMKMPPDSTPSGKIRNRALHDLVKRGPLDSLYNAAKGAFEGVGCSDLSPIRLFNTQIENYDVVFQLCSPSLEYQISDLPKSVQFTGVLPRRDTPIDYQYPEWWEEITHKRTGRQVIFVSQGTVSVDYTELIIPSIEAFNERDDYILIAALGVKGATLGDQVNLASNIKVIDYLPYDLILEASDVFVTNGGYGAFTHGIRNGCPMIIAGESEEKAEVAARAVYAGVAVNLGAKRPTPSQLARGVEQVVRNVNYRHRAVELRKENEDMNALEKMRDSIDALFV